MPVSCVSVYDSEYGLQQVNAEGEVRWNIQPLNRQLSFDKGFYVFIRSLQLLSRHNKGCTIVGLAGAVAGAGFFVIK